MAQCDMTGTDLKQPPSTLPPVKEIVPEEMFGYLFFLFFFFLTFERFWTALN